VQLQERAFRRAENAPPIALIVGFERSEHVIHGYALLAETDEAAAASKVTNLLRQVTGIPYWFNEYDIVHFGSVLIVRYVVGPGPYSNW
jgi:hypothetical protein